MKEVNREVELRVRQKETEFQKVNSSHLPRGPERLGESKRSTSILKSNGKLMELLMPELLGITYGSPSWESRLTQYFGALTAYVDNTKKLETGHRYTLNDPERQKYIDELVKNNKSITSDETLADYVESNINYDQRFLYGTPINKLDYLHYRVALEHGHVANNVEDVDSSNKIRFYLYTEQERKEKVKREAEVKRAIIKAQSKLMASDELLANAIWAYSLINPKGNVDLLSEDELTLEIERIAKNDPKWLIDASTDKDLELKAKVSKYVLKGILYQLPGSETIADGSNKDEILGNDIDAVITFFKNSDNSQKVNAYEMKYKNLLSKNKK